MDERRQFIVTGAISVIGVLAYIGLLGYSVYKYISTKDITSITTELVFILLIPFMFLWLARKDESLLIPDRLSGKPLPTENDSESKRERRRFYLADSTLFALVMTIFQFIDHLRIQKSGISIPSFLPG